MDGITISNLSGPSSLVASQASFSQEMDTSPMSRWANVVSGAARAGVEHRHVLEQLADVLLRRRIAAAGLLHRPGPAREVVPARAARGLRIRRDHAMPGLREIAPVLDALRIALAHQENNRRGVGRASDPAGALPSSPAVVCRWLAIWSMSPASASVTTSAARPSITERAWRPEPPCDWLILTVSPVFFFQYSANDLLKSDVQLARRVVRDVEQRDFGGLRDRRGAADEDRRCVSASSSRRFQFVCSI